MKRTAKIWPDKTLVIVPDFIAGENTYIVPNPLPWGLENRDGWLAIQPATTGGFIVKGWRWAKSLEWMPVSTFVPVNVNIVIPDKSDGKIITWHPNPVNYHKVGYLTIATKCPATGKVSSISTKQRISLIELLG